MPVAPVESLNLQAGYMALTWLGIDYYLISGESFLLCSLSTASFTATAAASEVKQIKSLVRKSVGTL